MGFAVHWWCSMSDVSEVDDGVIQGSIERGPATGSSGVAANSMTPSSRSKARPVDRIGIWLSRRTAQRLRARRVRRLVRHVEPWSVMKVALIFYFCLWGILLVAGVLLWGAAVSSGTIENIESFITDLFALKSFAINGDQLFRAAALGGLVMVVVGAGFTVLMAVLFNLISDLTGGIRMTVVEEETARPRPKRLRPRKPGGTGPVTVFQEAEAAEPGRDLEPAEVVNRDDEG